MANVNSDRFHANIPVLDMQDFFKDGDSKQAFIQGVSKAANEVGFFALVNTGIDPQLVKNIFSAISEFFHGVEENKRSIFKAELNGQRGYVPGEVAQEGNIKDNKEFIHFGKNKNLWPEYMDLKTPVKDLMRELDKVADILCRVFSIGMGENEDFLSEKVKGGESLLRALYYPKNPEKLPRAGKHTDIDLFTILLKASARGLIVIHKDQKIEVDVPDHSVIINCGDKLQNHTNGKFISAVHLVEGNNDEERFSIPYFVHSRDDEDMSPTQKCIAATTGVQNYPNATSFELLATRLRELNIANDWMKAYEKESGILERVAKLVAGGVAAEPVKLTHSLRDKNL